VDTLFSPSQSICCAVEKDKKITTLDENSIRELIGEEQAGDKAAAKVKKQQLKKQKKQVQARLAKDSGADNDDNGEEDEDEDEDLGAFAKTNKTKKR
jgi:DNA/RNA endonuclease YhcR with UshA esterase domain